ncbi:MAG: glycoside hydrolase family 3 protein [Luteolibacter sp.]
MKYKKLSLVPAVHCALGSVLMVLSHSAMAASPPWLTANDDKIKAIVEKMTLTEKAGQMTQPDSGSVKDLNDIATLALGSMLSGGSSDPESGNKLSDWADFYTERQKQSLKSRLGIPLIYGVDAVHGHNNILGAVIFPHNIGLGCTRNPKLVEEIGRITAREVRASGIQWTFAPSVAVPRDIRWGRTYEGFSEDPAVVELLGTAMVRGLQGADLADKESVAACAKHFIGDGGTEFKPGGGEGMLDQGDVRIDEATLRAVHMAGYPAAIQAGVVTIMPSYSSWNGVKCSGNRHLLTDILKEELGFEGFLISDYNAIDQLVSPESDDSAPESNNAAGQVRSSNYKKCIEISINAGMDMVMLTDRYKEFIRLLQELVEEGKVPMSRIDDAVIRILRVKFAMGMMGAEPNLWPDKDLQKEFGSEARRKVARQAVAESVVLLKNENAVLPVRTLPRRIHLAGSGADDLGMQCGGWTISWQGERGDLTPGGTTILDAINAIAGKETEVTFTPDGSGSDGADLGIVVVGEGPYAEMKGDRYDLSLSKEDIKAVSAVKASGVPVVVIVLSGRPMILGEVAEKADAILAAWLPGTEGSGVIDVLTGAAPATGKLSFTWPRSTDQVPLGHSRKRIEDPLYPFGFGLSHE